VAVITNEFRSTYFRNDGANEKNIRLMSGPLVVEPGCYKVFLGADSALSSPIGCFEFPV
jgi:hypothetical protein